MFVRGQTGVFFEQFLGDAPKPKTENQTWKSNKKKCHEKDLLFLTIFAGCMMKHLLIVLLCKLMFPRKNPHLRSSADSNLFP